MQFCVECGTPNTMTASYCVKCQTLLVLTTGVIKKPRLPWTLKKKLIVIGSPILVLGAIIAIAIPKPSSVSLAVKVTAPHGGIFENGCDLTQGARDIGATEVEVVNYGSAAGSGSKSALVYKAVGSACVADANVSLYANNNYEVYVAGKLAGEISPEEIKAGSIVKAVPLEVTHDISGTITLSDNYLNCKSSSKGPDCTIPSNASVQAKFQKASLLCYGMGSFSDFKASGTPIAFTGVGTRESARGTLEAGVPSVSDYKSGKVLCEYKFTLKDVLFDDKGYLVKVGQHYTTPIKLAQLEGNSWNLDYEFKG